MANDLHTDSDAPVTHLVKGIVEDAQALLKQQFTLFKVEVQNDLRKTKQATVALILGGAVLFIGAIVLSFAVAHLLAWAFPDTPSWVWYATVGLVITGVGLILGYSAYAQFRSFNPLPDETVRALEENLEWKTKPR